MFQMFIKILVLLLGLELRVVFGTTLFEHNKNANSTLCKDALCQKIEALGNRTSGLSRSIRLNFYYLTKKNDFQLNKLQRNLNLQHEMMLKLLNESAENTGLLSKIVTMLNKSYKINKKTKHTNKKTTENTIEKTTKTTTTTTTNTNNKMNSLPINCAAALQRKSGIYEIEIPNSQLGPFEVYCLKLVRSLSNRKTWTLIQRRNNGSVRFSRTWQEYATGFGKLDGEFFLGLDKIHALTQTTNHELWIHFQNQWGINKWAKYSSFRIGNRSEDYILKSVGNFSGNAGDVLSQLVGQKWSTWDRDNTRSYIKCPLYKGGWWYKTCHVCNINSAFIDNEKHEYRPEQGMCLYYRNGSGYSIRKVHMAIRPNKYYI